MYVYICHKVILWIEKDFLDYLREWELSVAARDGFTAGEKAAMTMSRETVDGLRLTGMWMCL